MVEVRNAMIEIIITTTTIITTAAATTTTITTSVAAITITVFLNYKNSRWEEQLNEQ